MGSKAASSYDHENDTEDLAENLDPFGFYASKNDIDEEKNRLQQIEAQA